MNKPTSVQILPRLIRLRDAPFYLGMDKNRFNREVRKQLTKIPIGKHGIAFDRLELDAWVEQRKQCFGKITEEEHITRSKTPNQRSKNARKKQQKLHAFDYQEKLAAFQKIVDSIQSK